MTIPLSQRFQILERDSFTCRFCGKRAPETELEVDHLHPRSKGGSDGIDNLVTACRDCNRGKGDRIVHLPEDGWSTLVGKFFHTRDIDGYVGAQGRVISALNAEHFVVEYFSWTTGTQAGREVVPLARMVENRWAWYATADEMDYAYKYHIGILSCPKPRELVREFHSGGVA